jgi:hypothetical protein
LFLAHFPDVEFHVLPVAQEEVGVTVEIVDPLLTRENALELYGTETDWLPEFAVYKVVPPDTTVEVFTGFVVDQEIVVEQEFPSIGIVHAVGEAEIDPVGAGMLTVIKLDLEVVPVYVAFRH